MRRRREGNPEAVRGILKEIVADMMQAEPFRPKSPSVILVVGVNGVGKTTTIGKLACHFKDGGKSVILAAADTFRAAATEQLTIWAQRAGVPIVAHGEGADPAAVVFDAVASAKAKRADLLIVDTAGRLHNKSHLMEELKKIRRVIDRDFPQADVHVLLVLDGATGQNGVTQARVFRDAVDLSGIVLTKLDGTSKGGVVISIKEELQLPVYFVGVGGEEGGPAGLQRPRVRRGDLLTRAQIVLRRADAQDAERDCWGGHGDSHDELPMGSNPTGRCAFLMNVYTAPEYRRQGVAARVVRACIEDARARGAGSLLLESTQMGEPLYRSLGFAPAKGYMRLSLRD